MLSFKEAFDQQPQNIRGEPEIRDTLSTDVPYDVSFPSIGLREVDYALKKWFVEDQPIYIQGSNSNNPTAQGKKVEVIFATEERWSMMQKHPEMRDSNGQLRLPIISIRRDNVDLLAARTVPVDELNTAGFTLYVQEYINPSNQQKEYILNNRKDATVPVMEMIRIQAPKYVTVSYSVIFWSNFTSDLNQMIQHMLRKFGQHHAIYVNEFLWFGAILQGLTNDSNDSSIQQDERIFKTSFNIVVEAPLVDVDSIKRSRATQGINMQFQVQTVAPKDQAKLKEWLRKMNNPYRIRR